MLIDSHAHLFDEQFEDDIDEVIIRARDNNVRYIIVPATNIETAKQAIQLAEKYPMVFAAVGVHPHDTANWDISIIVQLKEMAKHPKVAAIGEIGLDYFYYFAPKEKQIEAFREQIELAISLDLPAVIHSRNSDIDMMEIIRSYSGAGLRAQFHCFNSNLENALDIISMGHLISFTGNITFKKADELRTIVKQIPLDSLMIETDSPYLAPVPLRGKRNEPANVAFTAKAIAELHDTTPEKVGDITSSNAIRFFSIGNSGKLVYTYPLGKSLYINVTNRCNADCVFCARKEDAVIDGYNLRMKKNEEPGGDVYIKEIGDPKSYNEIVFCGYGEPTIRWNVIQEIAAYVKANGGTTRLNTNGHGNLINKRDITPEMEGKIDTVSISLNSTDKKQYSELMRVSESHFDEMINFAKMAKQYTYVVLSVVNYPGIDLDNAKLFAEKEVGVNFRIRDYF